MKLKKCKNCDSLTHLSLNCFKKSKKSPPRFCKYCRSHTHPSFKCFNKPVNPKKVRRLSRSVAKWLATRKEWFKQNKAESYNCFYCGRFLLKSEVTLDHYHSRSRHPELRYELSNLRVCCALCNQMKGSRSGNEFTVDGI